MNIVTLTGTLARDPQLRYRDNKPEVLLDVCCVERVPNAQGKWESHRLVVPVWVVGKHAERTAGWFKKDSLVDVLGKLKVFEIKTKSGGIAKACAIFASRVDPVKAS